MSSFRETSPKIYSLVVYIPLNCMSFQFRWNLSRNILISTCFLTHGAGKLYSCCIISNLYLIFYFIIIKMRKKSLHPLFKSKSTCKIQMNWFKATFTCSYLQVEHLHTSHYCGIMLRTWTFNV